MIFGFLPAAKMVALFFAVSVVHARMYAACD